MFNSSIFFSDSDSDPWNDDCNVCDVGVGEVRRRSLCLRWFNFQIWDMICIGETGAKPIPLNG